MFDVITGRRSFAGIGGSAAGGCEASAKKSYAPERVERCGVLTACVARRATELLNAKMDCQGCHFHLGGEHPTIRSAGFDP